MFDSQRDLEPIQPSSFVDKTMDYNKIKKLDEESLRHMTESKGPSDKCICHLLYTPDEKKSLRKSIKNAFAALGGGKSKNGKKDNNIWEDVEAPLDFTKPKKGGLFSTKERVKRFAACGKCGCDDEDIVLKHSMATIRIVTPDISSFCPCPEDCMPDKLKNNINVTVEHVKTIISDIDESAILLNRRCVSDTELARKTSLLSMDDEKYDEYDYESEMEDSDGESGAKVDRLKE